jgi:hypothetical protein
MKAARSPREPPHQTPGPRGRVSQQRRRSPEPDCPRRSSPPGTRETRRLPAIDPLNEAPHLIPPQIAAESYSANQIIQCVFTQRGSNSVVPVMSAARPLFPRKRTSICDLAMSHSCQLRTHAPQQIPCLFDHLVGAREQHRRDFETKRPGGRQIDDQLELTRLHDRQVSGVGALEDATGIDADLTIRIRNVGSIAHQPTCSR